MKLLLSKLNLITFNSLDILIISFSQEYLSKCIKYELVKVELIGSELKISDLFASMSINIVSLVSFLKELIPPTMMTPFFPSF